MIKVTLVTTDLKSDTEYSYDFEIDPRAYQLDDFKPRGRGQEYLRTLLKLRPGTRGLFSYLCWPEEFPQ